MAGAGGTDNRGIFPGWQVVWAIMVILAFASGLSFYNHAIYLSALAERPAFSVSTASLAVSVFFLCSGATGLLVMRWVQDHDARYVVVCGAIVSCLCLCALGRVATLGQLLAVYAAFGAGFSASGLIPTTTVLTRWFRRRRALALSIASTGLSIGGITLTPLSVMLVELWGFSAASVALGLLYALGVIPVACRWLRPSPAAMGLDPDGDERTPEPLDGALAPVMAAAPRPGQGQGAGELPDSAANAECAVAAAPRPAASAALVEGVSAREAWRSRFFWGVSAAFMALLMAQVGALAHQYGLARERVGELAALAVAIVPIASIMGRLAGGWIIDRFSTRRFALAIMALNVAALATLAAGQNMASLGAGLFMFGVAVGNVQMLQPLIIAEAFGIREYPRIFSLASLLSSWGTAAGPALLGVLYAVNGNQFSLSYGVAAALGLVGLGFYLAGGAMPRVQVGDRANASTRGDARDR